MAALPSRLRTVRQLRTRMRSLRGAVDALRPRRSIRYAPDRNGLPDPGEVVWAWVPYEEDASQGKDRPVLLIGTSGSDLLALPLTSKDRTRDPAELAEEARRGRHWMDVGTGAWDRQRRPSEVRLDRLLHLTPSAVRREGAALPRSVFDAVLAAAARHHDLR